MIKSAQDLIKRACGSFSYMNRNVACRGTQQIWQPRLFAIEIARDTTPTNGYNVIILNVTDIYGHLYYLGEFIKSSILFCYMVSSLCESP